MESLLAHCNTAFSGQGSVFLVFFLGGLTGSLTHCLTMCGPMVACQAACGDACASRFSAASQWQYHAGRFVAYGLLGFAASFVAAQLSSYSFWPTLSASMLLMAGALFLFSGIFPTQHRWSKLSSKYFFLRGILMSFMPCGLLYAALMMTAMLPNPISGMVAMWCFVLGTMPALVMTSGTTALLTRKWQAAMGRIGRIGLTFNGLTLLAMAARIAR